MKQFIKTNIYNKTNFINISKNIVYKLSTNQ